MCPTGAASIGGSSSCVSLIAMLMLPTIASNWSQFYCQICASVICEVNEVPLQGLLQHTHHRKSKNLVGTTMQLEVYLAAHCRQSKA